MSLCIRGAENFHSRKLTVNNFHNMMAVVLPKGLAPGTHRLGLRQFIDFDYVAKLSPAEAEWLARFAEEYYRGGNHGIHPAEKRRQQDTWRKRASEDVLAVPQGAAILLEYREAPPFSQEPLSRPVAALSEFARTLRPELGERRQGRPRAPHLERVNREIIALNARQLEETA